VVEETVFKLLVGRASELGVDGFCEFKRRYAVDGEFRRACYPRSRSLCHTSTL